MAGLALLKKHHVEFNILACVNAANAPYPLQVYRFLRDEVSSQFIQFIPIVETGAAARAARRMGNQQPVSHG